MTNKIFSLNYWTNEEGKFAYSLEDKNLELLIVSQFTLLADVKKGKKPSWHRAAKSQHGKELYDFFIHECRSRYKKIQEGVFGAYMLVELVNDGPMTLILNSDELF